MAGPVDYAQFKGKPFQVISKLGVRYTGIFDRISQADQTICLAEVFNHGTEDRPTARKIAGKPHTLGWVLFHTESIESLAMIENYVPPSEPAEDPIIASVSRTAPASAPPVPAPAEPTISAPPPPPASVSPQPSTSQQRHQLPPRPDFQQSASTAMDRVQQSLSDLSMNPRQTRGPRQHHPKPEVPDAEFDFSAGNEALQKDREQRRRGSEPETPLSGPIELGEPEKPPHPAAIVSNGHGAVSPPPYGVNGSEKKAQGGYKKSSFFDNLSADSARVSRADERHRNLDTFGEAGGRGFGQGGRGRGGYGRGGYGGQGQGRGGYGGYGGYGGQGQGQGPRGGYRGGQGGYRGRGGVPPSD